MRKGFTLVELAIVLVIVGLLIGGILAAQSMINTAKIQSQIQQIQQIEVAITNFRTTYNSLPGDCNKLAASGSQPDRTAVGDNDGKITGYIWDGATGDARYALSGNQGWILTGDTRSEWRNVFDHLAVTKMYEFKSYDETSTSLPNGVPGILYPKMIIDSNPTAKDIVPIGGVVVGYEPGPVSYMNEGHKIKLGQCPSSITWPNVSSFWCGPIPKNAAAIDSKIDDGRPYSGKTYITSNHYTFRVPSGLVGDSTNDCGNSTTNQYRTTSQTGNCVTTFETSF